MNTTSITLVTALADYRVRCCDREPKPGMSAPTFDWSEATPEELCTALAENTQSPAQAIVAMQEGFDFRAPSKTYRLVRLGTEL
jgi:hypothetical protein